MMVMDTLIKGDWSPDNSSPLPSDIPSLGVRALQGVQLLLLFLLPTNDHLKAPRWGKPPVVMMCSGTSPVLPDAHPNSVPPGVAPLIIKHRWGHGGGTLE